MRRPLRILICCSWVIILCACQDLPNPFHAQPAPASSMIAESVSSTPISLSSSALVSTDGDDESARLNTLETDNARLKRELAAALKENARLKKDLAGAIDDNSLLRDLAARGQR